jgi:UDP-2-acetamido-2-deoxy-ribo-hexuluronate aminotransferase
MDTVQAAVVLCKLEIFREEVERRWEIGQRYSALIDDSATAPIKPLVGPCIQQGNKSVYAQFTIEVDQRDKVAALLAARGIPTAVHYPTPLHLQPAFAYLGKGVGHCVVAERAAKRVISLPMHPYLREDDQKTIIRKLYEAVGSAAS